MDTISFPVRGLAPGAARVLAASSGPTCLSSVPNPSELVPEEEDAVLEESLPEASREEAGKGSHHSVVPVGRLEFWLGTVLVVVRLTKPPPGSGRKRRASARR